MPLAFRNVPDWNSWENQGANIACAHLDDSGQPGLVVLRVDRPTPGPNRGFYRVGRALDADGNVTSGWGPWIEIPGWASDENQGAGVAIAEFPGGNRGIVVFQVQHVTPGPNRGLYRVGRTLDAQGNVTGGWSPWREVPNWISWRDQGAAITVSDLDNDGEPELVVLHVDDFHGDHPRQPNKAFYRVGHGLTADAEVSGWSDWIEVDWFSWFNQGAGIAFADLDNDGRPEIVVYQIDNPPGLNAGFYRVGWSIDTEGRVQNGWGPWVRVDENWRSFEDQGGGFALASFGGARPKAVLFHVDSAATLNEGLYAVTDLTLDIDAAAENGVWRMLPYLSEVLPVHAGLLHDGRVLFFAGSGNNVFRFESDDFGNKVRRIYTSVVWDPTKNVLDDGTFNPPPTLRRPDGSVIDFFCCGHTFLADGRVLVVGGTRDYDKIIVNGQMQDAGHGFTGTREAVIFDPENDAWTPADPMHRGRWYPTAVSLPNGSILVASGTDETGDGLDDNTLERIVDPDHGTWTVTQPYNLPLYPHLFPLSDGRLLFTGGKMDTEEVYRPQVFDPLGPPATQLLAVPDEFDLEKTNQCASVVLPPAQDELFMILGGGPEDEGQERGQATHRVGIVDMHAADPRYQLAAPLHHERMHVNAVLLPDRTVLAVGGGVTREASAQSNVVDPQGGREVFEAEIYDPGTDRWTLTAPATVARLYHSVALLLPDGRVVAAGGNPDKGSQVDWLPPDPLEEMRLEIFSPPYLFRKARRPEISQVDVQIRYGTQVPIRTPDAGNLQSACLIRPGLTTHSFNGTQRLVDLPIAVTSASEVRANVPTNRAVLPAGWYMLFLTDNDGVPSVARWVHVS